MIGERGLLHSAGSGREWQSLKSQWQATVIVNLNHYRKKRRRAEAERRAADNRVRFGCSKEERRKDLRERERSKSELEGKHLD